MYEAQDQSRVAFRYSWCASCRGFVMVVGLGWSSVLPKVHGNKGGPIFADRCEQRCAETERDSAIKREIWLEQANAGGFRERRRTKGASWVLRPWC